jgi:hypothetical protein
LQKELLEAYEQASRAWVARVQSEVALWSELATKLTATRPIPEALEAYTKCVSQRMQMTAEDGQRVFKDCQQITQKITKSLTNRWPSHHVAASSGFGLTELAVIAFRDGCATLLETGPGISVAQVVAATQAELVIPKSVPEMAM